MTELKRVFHTPSDYGAYIFYFEYGVEKIEVENRKLLKSVGRGKLSFSFEHYKLPTP